MDTFKKFNENAEFKELDSVISIVDIENIPKGTKGCIVHDYKNNNNYVVEFFDDDSRTLSVIDVNKNEIEKRIK